MIAHLKGSAASDANDGLSPHQGHHLVAELWTYIDEDTAEIYDEPFVRLRCLVCNVIVLELVE